MKCDDCKFADWRRTANGRLHPGKTGNCAFKWEPPPIPSAFYVPGQYTKSTVRLVGGLIERGRDIEACPCYAEKDASK